MCRVKACISVAYSLVNACDRFFCVCLYLSPLALLPITIRCWVVLISIFVFMFVYKSLKSTCRQVHIHIFLHQSIQLYAVLVGGDAVGAAAAVTEPIFALIILIVRSFLLASANIELFYLFLIFIRTQTTNTDYHTKYYEVNCMKALQRIQRTFFFLFVSLIVKFSVQHFLRSMIAIKTRLFDFDDHRFQMKRRSLKTIKSILFWRIGKSYCRDFCRCRRCFCQNYR